MPSRLAGRAHTWSTGRLGSSSRRPCNTVTEPPSLSAMPLAATSRFATAAMRVLPSTPAVHDKHLHHFKPLPLKHWVVWHNACHVYREHKPWSVYAHKLSMTHGWPGCRQQAVHTQHSTAAQQGSHTDDFAGTTFRSKHGQYTGATAHIQHAGSFH